MIPDVMLNILLYIKDQIRHAHQLRVTCLTWMRQNKKTLHQNICSRNSRLKNVNDRKNPSPREIFEQLKIFWKYLLKRTVSTCLTQFRYREVSAFSLHPPTHMETEKKNREISCQDKSWCKILKQREIYFLIGEIAPEIQIQIKTQIQIRIRHKNTFPDRRDSPSCLGRDCCQEISFRKCQKFITL